MIRSTIPGRLLVIGFALWAGVLFAIALLALPSAFAVLERHQAGMLANRLFFVEAHASLMAVAASLLGLVALDRFQAVPNDRPRFGFSLSAVALGLGVIAVCTVLGYFVISPLMAQARAGEGSFSFGALHAFSSAMFAIKTLTLLGLVWYVS